MRSQLTKVQLKTGETVEVLPTEISVLKEAGKLLEENQEAGEVVTQNKPEEQKQSGYKLPALNRKERKQRIRQAKKLVKVGYSIREVGRKLGVSHTSILRWKRKGWNVMERYGTL
jgi:DNA invertase Pin-like site-specific DNA recombinase